MSNGGTFETLCRVSKNCPSSPELSFHGDIRRGILADVYIGICISFSIAFVLPSKRAICRDIERTKKAIDAKRNNAIIADET